MFVLSAFTAAVHMWKFIFCSGRACSSNTKRKIIFIFAFVQHCWIEPHVHNFVHLRMCSWLLLLFQPIFWHSQDPKNYIFSDHISCCRMCRQRCRRCRSLSMYITSFCIWALRSFVVSASVVLSFSFLLPLSVTNVLDMCNTLCDLPGCVYVLLATFYTYTNVV